MEDKIFMALEMQNFTNPTHDFFLQHLMRQQLVHVVPAVAAGAHGQHLQQAPLSRLPHLNDDV